jgi:RNA polymerase sigma factor (sigma-70 family)
MENNTKSRQATIDATLVALLQGDGTGREKTIAFNQLYDNHKKQVLTYFFRKGGNNVTEDDAEDLSMVTFTKIHLNIASYDDKFAFSTWLYKIAERTLIDFLRKKNVEVISIEKLSNSSL